MEASPRRVGSFGLLLLLLFFVLHLAESIPLPVRIPPPPPVLPKQGSSSSLIDVSTTAKTTLSSSPVTTTKQTEKSSPTTTYTLPPTLSPSDEKAKRSIREYPIFARTDDESEDSDESESSNSQDVGTLPYYNKFNEAGSSEEEEDHDGGKHVLFAETKEVPAQIHDKTGEAADSDDSRVFTDESMTPGEMTNVVRRRRNTESDTTNMNRRKKRGLSSYDLFDEDPLYEPTYADLLESQRFQRLSRAYSPLYWQPSIYARSVRSSYPYFEQRPSYWYNPYNDEQENEDEENQGYGLFNGELDRDEDDDNEEVNRYPILLKSDDREEYPYFNVDDMREMNDGNDSNEFDNDNDDDEEEPMPFYRPSYNHRLPAYF